MGWGLAEMDVRVTMPFRAEFDILAIEERFPSLEIAISLVDDHMSGCISYRGTVWVEQAVWSAFLEALASTSFNAIRELSTEIAFGDLDQAFRFGLGSRGEAVLLRASCGPWRPPRRAAFEIAACLDDDTFGHVQRAFAACPIR